MSSLESFVELAEVLFLSGQTEGLDQLVSRFAPQCIVDPEWTDRCYRVLASGVYKNRELPLPSLLKTLVQTGMRAPWSGLAPVFSEAVLRASRPEWLPDLADHGLYDEDTVLRWAANTLDYRPLPFLVRNPQRVLTDRQIVEELHPRLVGRASSPLVKALQRRTREVLALEIVESWLRSCPECPP